MISSISIILNIILGIISIYLFIKNRKIDRLTAEKNYNHTRLEINELWEKKDAEYIKKAVQLGARLDDNGRVYERSFRGLDYSLVKELDAFSVKQDNELSKKRNELNYWSKIGNIDTFSDKPVSLIQNLRNKISSFWRKLK